MPTDFEEMKKQLLASNDEFRQLATQHHDLDERIHNLAIRQYLSEPEQLEEVTLKKTKAPAEGSDGEHAAASRPSEPAHAVAASEAILQSEFRGRSIVRPAFFYVSMPRAFMKIDKAGVPFIAGALVPAALLAGARRYGWAAGFAALGAFFAYFFRDPERVIPAEPGLVVSPADGKRHDRRSRRSALEPARRLEADHDLPVADGRAHQPHAGRRPGHARRISPGHVPARPTRKRRATTS